MAHLGAKYFFFQKIRLSRTNTNDSISRERPDRWKERTDFIANYRGYLYRYIYKI